MRNRMTALCSLEVLLLFFVCHSEGFRFIAPRPPHRLYLYPSICRNHYRLNKHQSVYGTVDNQQLPSISETVDKLEENINMALTKSQLVRPKIADDTAEDLDTLLIRNMIYSQNCSMSPSNFDNIRFQTLKIIALIELNNNLSALLRSHQSFLKCAMTMPLNPLHTSMINKISVYLATKTVELLSEETYFNKKGLIDKIYDIYSLYWASIPLEEKLRST